MENTASTNKDTHLGKHILAEFFLADKDQLSNGKQLEEELGKAAQSANAKVVGSSNSTSSDDTKISHGVSAHLTIPQCNFNIHSWPDHGYARADFFTSDSTVDPWKALDYLKDFLKAKKFKSMEISTGSTVLLNNPNILDDH